MEKPWKIWPQSLALAAALTLGMTVVAQDEDEPEFHDEDQAKEENLDERREELTTMAEQTIDNLSDRHEAAARLLDRAHGWAVLDTTKGGFIVTGAGGTGVAKEIGSHEAVFMHVGGAGIGAVGGLSNYKLVLLFDDETTFEQFVDGEWQGSASAQAVAGDEGVSEQEGFIDGAAVFRVDQTGLIAQAELQGMRFWPSDRLNELP
jgi:lipid-binding SYLF domain-containing protein